MLDQGVDFLDKRKLVLGVSGEVVVAASGIIITFIDGRPCSVSLLDQGVDFLDKRELFLSLTREIL